jgi:hypothetical protein
VVPCCNCLADAPDTDLSTGRASPIDLVWKVNNGNAYTTAPDSWWITSLSPAKWIQPVANSTPGLANPGLYHYTTKFFVPSCTTAADVQLVGSFAADNSGKVYIDGGSAIASCTNGFCFNSNNAPITFNASLAPGFHVLRIDVQNNSGNPGATITGLVVNAHLARKCPGCERCPYIGTFDGANCYIGQPPSGATAFIYANSFYYSPLNSNQCPRPGSTFDSANCYVMPVPTQATPFIYSNGWYVAPVVCNTGH